jgi:hypothetical protein
MNCESVAYLAGISILTELQRRDRAEEEVCMKPVVNLSRAAEEQLKSFIDKFDSKHQALIRSVRKALRKLLPTANEVVYDNYNFFVIGFSATERPSDTIVSIAAAANGVGLAFYRGATLPDPHKILAGSGTQNRFVRLDSAARLADPQVKALIDAAVAQSKTPLPAQGRGKLIIRSVSAAQRPRRKPVK